MKLENIEKAKELINELDKINKVMTAQDPLINIYIREKDLYILINKGKNKQLYYKFIAALMQRDEEIKEDLEDL